MQLSEFKDIYLSKREFETLISLNNGTYSYVHSVIADELLRHELISKYNNCADTYVIATKGMRYLEYRRLLEIENNNLLKEKLHNKIHLWINSIISILAFVLSLLTYLTK